MDPDISAGEAFPPQEIARKIERIGVAKANAARNILAVTGGNVIGGTLLVAGVYWAAYLRGEKQSRPTRAEHGGQ